MNLNGMHSGEYPNPPQIDGAGYFNIPSVELLEIIKQTAFAVSKNETRPLLTVVNLSIKENKLTCVATNSHRLALRELPLESKVTGSFIIPSKSLNELTKLFNNEADIIHIFLTDSYIVFQTNHISLFSRLIKGNYPNVSELLPKDLKTIITVDTKTLLKGIDRACLFASEWRNNYIKKLAEAKSVYEERKNYLKEFSLKKSSNNNGDATHHFSLETGFVTSIEPDLLVANDDTVILEMSKWYYSFGQSVLATSLLRGAANRASKKLVHWVMKPDGVPTKVGKWASAKGFRDTMKLADDGSNEMKVIMQTLDDIIKTGNGDITALRTKLVQQFDNAYKNFTPSSGKASLIKDTSRKALLKSGGTFAKILSNSDDIAKVGQGITNIVKGVASFTPVGWIVNGAIWIGTEMLFEHYRRFRENLQCVVAIPLTYRGQELTAGINSHAGMIYGDAPGRMDRLTGATFRNDDGDEIEGTFGGFMFELANLITGTPGAYRS